jgi:hypothetical protein
LYMGSSFSLRGGSRLGSSFSVFTTGYT